MLKLTLMFLLALLPVFWLIIALTFLRIKTHIAATTACLIAFVEAMLIWQFPFILTTTAMLEGFALAAWPILIVILAAVFTYNMTVHTKAMDVIKHMITSVTSDKRIMMVLIAFCFGGFLEGIAGFGVAVAIPATMMVALGYNPVKSILVCLIANGAPTMFGSIGIPTVTLSSITELDASLLGVYQIIQVAPLLFISPFLMVGVIGDGIKSVRGIIPVLIVTGISFIIPEMLTIYFIGPELAVIVASISSLVFTILAAKAHDKRHAVPEEYDVPVHDHHEAVTLKSALIAWSPFIIIFIVLMFTSKVNPVIYYPLSSIKTTVQIFQGTDAKPYTFVWLNTPGVLMLLSAIVGGLIQGCKINDFILLAKNTFIQMSRTVITMLAVMGCSKIMSYSGMISSVSLFFVTALGSFYPLVAPLIGALGTFVTASGTSSAVLFGNLQFEAAQALSINEYWLCGSNMAGVTAGKMIAPQSITIGCAACGVEDKIGELLQRVFKYALGYLIYLSIIVYIGSLIV